MTEENKIENTTSQASPVGRLVSHDLYLNGDLCQMGAQRSFLTMAGFSLGQSNVYPIVFKKDVIRALTAIWHHKVEGWWHYREDYIKYGICDLEAFKIALAMA